MRADLSTTQRGEVGNSRTYARGHSQLPLASRLWVWVIHLDKPW